MFGDSLGKAASNTSSWSGSSFNELSPQIIERLKKDLQLSTEQAAGIVGNLGHESAGFQTMQEVNPISGRGGLGWAQWTGPRRRDYEQFAASMGLDTSSPEANYQFLLKELRGSESNALSALRNTSTASEATRSFQTNFERAGVVNYASRDRYTNQALSAYGDAGAVPQVDT